MISDDLQQQIQTNIDTKTKPPGSLGQLESLAAQLAKVQAAREGHLGDTITLNKPQAIVFAGDHGIAEQGISIAPSAVTQQMVLNFLTGGAAINCFCRSADIDLKVVDCGMLQALQDSAALPLSHNYIEQRLGDGTADLSQQAAMSLSQVEKGLGYGAELVKNAVENGSQIMLFGEMGIGNTSPSAALLAAITGKPVAQCIGRGTGINDEQYEKKQSLIESALGRIQDQQDPKTLLAELGGFEIVQMVGAFVQAGESKTVVIVDGFIATVAALVASKLSPSCREIMVFGHRSQESGHKIALEALNADPMLDLGLRLGEGTGAALAFPIVKAAAAFYNDMATFASAGVTV
ncbi:nicotinate-nucleotide--dimethylbenzimidazole phosphoribosyltransferase [Vibrio sp. SCSIO 43136]|uniref:nicotinate-nucleotide--dimethylbenzimidazole phosphoribosyltransferase n=1 Tax=Vibrio sp. SCSIO 43136 TaxID=2819101 RepID=UPI002075F180|nr:nicotinate-nucleotide--dimethylbenzimidazole phosphoribosyltransferase [Vibrio sp. SCSIO 43136]USD63987.1 nicotinate-nucleotide--dimethylbenzimidazole phosphoribosyltransferase [Vibrio sp. SCSIO 43136]